MILCSTTNFPKSVESIRALRAIAALLVTIFHLSMKMETVSIYSPVLRCFKAGFGGVDLFFIISGFIIMHTNQSKMNRPDQFLPYLKKRFGRIYSIYWLFLLLAGLFLIGLNGFAPSLKWLSYQSDPAKILKALLLLPTHESILPVTWTLSFEIYFYVLFGLVIASRFLLIIPIAVLIGTVITGFGALAGQPYVFGFRFNDFLFSPFNFEFGFGIAAYFFIRRSTVKIPRFLISLAVLVFFLAGEFINPAEIWLRIWGLGIPATVILLGLVRREQSSGFRYPAWLLKLGDASYILYLIHVPLIMVLTQALLLLNLFPYVLVANFLLIGVLCRVSWQLHQRIEKPLLQWINTPQPVAIDLKYRSVGTPLLRIFLGKPQTTHKMIVR